MPASPTASPAAAPPAAGVARPPEGARAPRSVLVLEVALVAVVVWACFSDGATRVPAETRIQVSLVVLAALAAAAWAAGRALGLGVSRLGAAGVVGVAGFAAWSGLSLGWTITPSSSWALTNRALAYALALVLGVVIGASDPRALRRLPVLMLVGIVVVGLYAFGTKALPGLHVGPLDLDDSGIVSRLRAPLGYWNAEGLLCVLGSLLALRVASGEHRRPRDRGLALGAAYLLVCTLGLTYSRGGFVALALGLAVLTALGPARLRGLLLAAVVGIAATPVLAVGFTLDGIAESARPLSERSSDGRILLAVFIVCIGLVVAGLLGVLQLERRVSWDGRRTREVFRGVAILASFAVLAGTVGLAVSEQGLPRTIQDRFERFTEPGGDDALQADRLVDAGSGNRWVWWREAAGAWSDKPVAGWGAGSFAALHLRYRQDEIPVTEAHSTPMQFLSETGLVGALLGVGGILALLAAGVARVRESTGPERAMAGGLLACGVAWAAHGLYDWDWDFPAVTLPVLVLLGVLVGRPRAPREDVAQALAGTPSASTGTRVAALAVASVALAAFAVSAILPAWSQGKATAAQERLSETPTEEELVDAAAQAERAARLDPTALGPLQASAAIAKRRGRLLDARSFALEEVDRQPDVSRAWLDLAQASLDLVDRAGFERAALKALELDPRSTPRRALALFAVASRTPPGLSATAGGTPLAPAVPEVSGVVVVPPVAGVGTTGVTGASGTTGPTG